MIALVRVVKGGGSLLTKSDVRPWRFMYKSICPNTNIIEMNDVFGTDAPQARWLQMLI